MFENNQVKYEMLRDMVRQNWPDITDEEYSRTTGDLDRVVEMIAHHTGKSDDEIFNQLKISVCEDKPETGLKVAPAGVVNSQEPESKEWNARDSINNQ